MTLALDLAPATEAEVSEVLADCHARCRPLRIAGGGTRVENRSLGDPLSLSRLSGVVTYSPAEMTLIARRWEEWSPPTPAVRAACWQGPAAITCWGFASSTGRAA